MTQISHHIQQPEANPSWILHRHPLLSYLLAFIGIPACILAAVFFLTSLLIVPSAALTGCF